MLRLEMLSWGSVDEEVPHVPEIDDVPVDETEFEEDEPTTKVSRK